MYFAHLGRMSMRTKCIDPSLPLRMTTSFHGPISMKLSQMFDAHRFRAGQHF
jgi:hypothetical protein